MWRQSSTLPMSGGGTRATASRSRTAPVFDSTLRCEREAHAFPVLAQQLAGRDFKVALKWLATLQSGRRRRATNRKMALASVRRSNYTCGFPACSFHEDALPGGRARRCS
jgi:hypothetical protein